MSVAEEKSRPICLFIVDETTRLRANANESPKLVKNNKDASQERRGKDCDYNNRQGQTNKLKLVYILWLAFSSMENFQFHKGELSFYSTRQPCKVVELLETTDKWKKKNTILCFEIPTDAGRTADRSARVAAGRRQRKQWRPNQIEIRTAFDVQHVTLGGRLGRQNARRRRGRRPRILRLPIPARWPSGDWRHRRGGVEQLPDRLLRPDYNSRQIRSVGQRPTSRPSRMDPMGSIANVLYRGRSSGRAIRRASQKVRRKLPVGPFGSDCPAARAHLYHRPRGRSSCGIQRRGNFAGNGSHRVRSRSASAGRSQPAQDPEPRGRAIGSYNFGQHGGRRRRSGRADGGGFDFILRRQSLGLSQSR